MPTLVTYVGTEARVFRGVLLHPGDHLAFVRDGESLTADGLDLAHVTIQHVEGDTADAAALFVHVFTDGGKRPWLVIADPSPSPAPRARKEKK